MIEGAKATGADRIELYTEEYARLYSTKRETVIKPFTEASILANKLG
jgi:pyridoxine 5-phosphate synthase